MPPRTKHTVYQRNGNDPRFDLRSELYRIAGVDLTDVPGVSAITAQVILTEIGPDVSRFRMPPPLLPGWAYVWKNESAGARCYLARRER